MNLRRSAIARAAAMLLPILSLARAPRAEARALEGCALVPDTCCEAAPRFTAAAYAPFLGHPVMVGTFWNDSTGVLGTPYVLQVVDLFNPPLGRDCPLPSNPGQVDWNAPKYRAAGWTTDSLGLVFGLTLDRYGNIYVTHTSCYNYPPSDNVGFGGPGAIYRIDAVTGFVSLFARLPNHKDPAVSPGVDAFPGLGNITYDCDHDQFFVSDIEDGRIYRLKSTNPSNASPATVLPNPFDHGVLDTGPTNPNLPSTTPG